MKIFQVKKSHIRRKGDCTSVRRSSIEEVENVGTRSEPLIIVVTKCSPDSAKSHVIQAAAKLANVVRNSGRAIEHQVIEMGNHIDKKQKAY